MTELLEEAGGVKGPGTISSTPIALAEATSNGQTMVSGNTATESMSPPTSTSFTISPTTLTSTTSPISSSGLSAGAKAGIGVGVGVGVLLMLALLAISVLSMRKRRRLKRQEAAKGNPWEKPELETKQIDGEAAGLGPHMKYSNERCDAPAAMEWKGCCNEHKRDGFFCSSKCLKDDFNRFPKECRAEKEKNVMRRIGTLLEEVFCDLHERLFLFPFESQYVDDLSRNIFVTSTQRDEQSPVFFPFPPQNVLDDNFARRQLSSKYGCDAAMRFCRILLRTLLGTEYKITGVDILILHQPRPCLYSDELYDIERVLSTSHSVFCIQDGEERVNVLDLTRHQHGFSHEPIIDRETYFALREIDSHAVGSTVPESDFPHVWIASNRRDPDLIKEARYGLESSMIQEIEMVFRKAARTPKLLATMMWEDEESYSDVRDRILSDTKEVMARLWKRAHSPSTGNLRESDGMSFLR
ncbi:MAG: hypothetical protein M1828_001110 [Chrysothrix sp. TS-e1954]|nr:MAG: hypothetical protein M1828_001110 [Chrysothrix sp. TS-e1954]